MRIYEIHVEPISANNIYGNRTRRCKCGQNYRSATRFLCDHGREYKEFIHDVLEATDEENGDEKFEAEFVDLTMVFLLPHRLMYFKNGNVKSKDTTNFFKLVEDSVAEYLEIDDKRNLDVHGYKRMVSGDSAKIVVALREAWMDTDIVVEGVVLR